MAKKRKRKLGARKAIRLSIKGGKKNATREAARRKIPVWACETFKGTTYCDAPCTKERAIGEWFGAGTRARVKPGRGFPPGTLLLYSATSCERKRR